MGSSVPRVLYVQYTNPGGYPPLEHSSHILANAGCEVLFLGTGAIGTTGMTWAAYPHITVRQIPFCKGGWRQKLHYLRYTLWVLWVAITWRPQWVYASDPMSSPAAWIVSWLPGVRVVYHEHDSPEGGAKSLFMRAVERARRAVALRASICVLPNQGRLDRFRREVTPDCNGVFVWNCPPLYEVIPKMRDAVAGTIRVLYHGSIVPDRLPMSVIDSLVLLPDSVKLRIVGFETVGQPDYSAQLMKRAQAAGVADRVEISSAIPRADLLKLVASCDIGLALMPLISTDHNMATMAAASNKAFEYLANGLAVVVSALEDWCEIYVKPGYAVKCDPMEARSIATAITELISDPCRMRDMGERGRQRILSEWNYEKAFAPVALRLLGPQGRTVESAKLEACR